MNTQPARFSNDLSLKQAYILDVRRELISAFQSENWYGLGYLIQSWTRRCNDHIAASDLKPMLERAETQFQLARNEQPFNFVG